MQAWKGSVRYRISQIRDRIEAVEVRIERLNRQIEALKTDLRRAKLRHARHGKRRHLDRLRASHVRLQAELLGKPRVCFGGRKALRDGDVAGWKAARASSFTLVGSKDETAGNQSAQWDGTNLRLRLPDAMGGGHLVIPNVGFRYGQDALHATLERGGGITWRLFRDDAGVWQIRATVDEPAAEIRTDRRLGAIGIDLNVDHLADVSVDRMGNPVERRTRSRTASPPGAAGTARQPPSARSRSDAPSLLTRTFQPRSGKDVRSPATTWRPGLPRAGRATSVVVGSLPSAVQPYRWRA